MRVTKATLQEKRALAKLDYEGEKQRVEVANDPAPRKAIEYVEEKCYALLEQGASQEEATKASQRGKKGEMRSNTFLRDSGMLPARQKIMISGRRVRLTT